MKKIMLNCLLFVFILIVSLSSNVQAKLKVITDTLYKSMPTTPFSDAVIANNFMYLSGQIGINKNGELEKTFEGQVRRILLNLQDVLKTQNLTMVDVVKTNVYLTNINDIAVLNKIYLEVMGTHKPARTTVTVLALPAGALLEIEIIAALR